jgi:predicted DNA-binding transcriptional regulator YafY
MGRNLKVQPGQVKDFLKENGNAVTVANIADEFGVCKKTIGKRLNTLRGEGEPMLPTREGILYADKVTDEARAKLVKDAVEWVVSSLRTLVGIAAVEKRPLLQARKILESAEDRRQIKAQLMMLAHAIDIIDIDRQLEE